MEISVDSAEKITTKNTVRFVLYKIFVLQVFFVSQTMNNLLFWKLNVLMNSNAMTFHSAGLVFDGHRINFQFPPSNHIEESTSSGTFAVTVRRHLNGACWCCWQQAWRMVAMLGVQGPLVCNEAAKRRQPKGKWRIYISAHSPLEKWLDFGGFSMKWEMEFHKYDYATIFIEEGRCCWK